MTKKLTFAAALVAFGTISGAAQAQTDWSGFYSGLSYSDTNGAGIFGPPANIPGTASATQLGSFSGYNFQNGNWVYGGELAIQAGSGNLNVPAAPHQGTGIEVITDLKARLGYTYNNFLFYATVGASSDVIASDSPLSLNPYVLTATVGTNFGVGAEMKFDNGMFVGLEYLARDLTGDFGVFDPSFAPFISGPFTLQNESVSVRVGWQF